MKENPSQFIFQNADVILKSVFWKEKVRFVFEID